MALVGAAVTVLSVGCGSSSSGASSDDQQQQDVDGGASGASSGSLGAQSGDAGGSGSHDCSNPSAGDLAGCTCSGTTRACFTVDPGRRNRNGCSDGAQTCTKKGEFGTWGPCTGEVSTCPQGGGTLGDGGSTNDGGTGNGGGGNEHNDGGVGGGGGGGEDGGIGGGGGGAEDSGPTCQCYPGAVRYCDTPIACNWGKQTCMPDGTWGTCNETNDRPQGCSSGSAQYDESCCYNAGACCQDIYGGFLGNSGQGTSVGHCDNIACPGDISSFVPPPSSNPFGN